MNARIFPALYLNITEKCNMRCEYCPTYGENWETTTVFCPMSDLEKLIHEACKLGFESFRISGGEPFLFPERVFSILRALKVNNVTDVILNTNGFNLAEHGEKLTGFPIRKLKVSIDTLDPVLFKEITHTSKVDDVKEGIKSAVDAGLPVEINLVALRKNFESIFPLIQFCIEQRVSMKILDLVVYDSLVRNELDPEKYWESQYFDLAELVPILRERFGPEKIVRLSNDRGIPMSVFEIGDGLTLTLKSGKLGSTFADVCKKCTHFPCQEGLFHASVSAAGNLTPCRLRRDLTKSVVNLSSCQMAEELVSALSAFQNPFHVSDTVQMQK